MLSAIFGGLGSGKTLFLTTVGYFCQHTTIISNFELKYKNVKYEKLDLTKFINAEYENCIIFIDEAYAYLESRLSGSHANMLMSYILFQSRKKNVNMYLTFQLMSTIDKRYRQMIDLFIVANKNENGYMYQMFDKGGMYLGTKTLALENAKYFFQFYNTNEIILPNIQQRNQISENLMDGTSKMSLANQYVEELEKKYQNKRITKDMLIAYFEEKDYPSFLITMTWTELKNREKPMKEKKSKKKVVTNEN